MTSKISNKLKQERKNQYINRSFSDFKNELLNYANEKFSNQNRDFSEASLGGMLLDFAAIVGDSLSFYAEQQFNELNYETATVTDNIISHLRNAGIKSNNNSPSSVNVTFFIEINAKTDNNGRRVPNLSLAPLIKEGTELTSNSGINFTLVENIDFSEGFFQEVGDEEDDVIETFILSKKGLCISGQVSNENISFASGSQQDFLSYELSNEDVSDIILVVDDELNVYHEVDYLSQNTVYKKVENSNDSYLEIIPATHRFIREVNFANGRTTIRFGNGNGLVLKDNILDNPEDLLLPLKQTEYFSDKSLDPNKLINSNSLGISPAGKRVQIRYRHGGGLDHNVIIGDINEIDKLYITFPYSNNIEDDEEEFIGIRNSIEVFNEEEAIGGSDGLELDELKLQIPNAMKSQSRIITHEDLIGRIYTMPTNFGKINKAAAIDNPYSNGSKDLYVVCKDVNNFYVNASDAIKANLSKYLNEYRLIGDNFNILDVSIFNFGIKLEIRVASGFDIETVRSDLAFRIVENMRFDNLQIGEAIDTNGIINVALNTDGVTAVLTNQENIVMTKSETDEFVDEDTDNVLSYNNNLFDPISSYDEGFIYPEPGGIFEMRYTAQDIEIIVN
jgi:hypothetical protein